MLCHQHAQSPPGPRDSFSSGDSCCCLQTWDRMSCLWHVLLDRLPDHLFFGLYHWRGWGVPSGKWTKSAQAICLRCPAYGVLSPQLPPADKAQVPVSWSQWGLCSYFSFLPLCSLSFHLEAIHNLEDNLCINLLKGTGFKELKPVYGFFCYSCSSWGQLSAWMWLWKRREETHLKAC